MAKFSYKIEAITVSGSKLNFQYVYDNQGSGTPTAKEIAEEVLGLRTIKLESKTAGVQSYLNTKNIETLDIKAA